MPSEQQVKDKHGVPIKEGDTVYTKIRGGRHEGEVDKVVTGQKEAEKEGVKNPPKVSPLPALQTPICFPFSSTRHAVQVGACSDDTGKESTLLKTGLITDLGRM